MQEHSDGDILSSAKQIIEEDVIDKKTKKIMFSKGGAAYNPLIVTKIIENLGDDATPSDELEKVRKAFKRKHGSEKKVPSARIPGHGQVHFMTRETIIDLLPFFKCVENKLLVAQAWGVELAPALVERVEIELNDGAKASVEVRSWLECSSRSSLPNGREFFYLGCEVVVWQVDKTTDMICIEDMVTATGHNWNAAYKQIMIFIKNEPEMKAKVKFTKLNGKGMKKYCTNLETMLVILWKLPYKDAMRAFASKCAKDLVRQMKGDPSLIDEINRNHENLQATGTLRFQEAPAPESLQEAVPDVTNLIHEQAQEDVPMQENEPVQEDEADEPSTEDRMSMKRKFKVLRYNERDVEVLQRRELIPYVAREKDVHLRERDMGLQERDMGLQERNAQLQAQLQERAAQLQDNKLQSKQRRIEGGYEALNSRGLLNTQDKDEFKAHIKALCWAEPMTSQAAEEPVEQPVEQPEHVAQQSDHPNANPPRPAMQSAPVMAIPVGHTFKHAPPGYLTLAEIIKKYCKQKKDVAVQLAKKCGNLIRSMFRQRNGGTKPHEKPMDLPGIEKFYIEVYSNQDVQWILPEVNRLQGQGVLRFNNT